LKMCIGAPLAGVQSFAPLTMPSQAMPQVMFLQMVPADKVPMLMTAVPVMYPVQVPLAPQKPLSVATCSDDDSSEGTPMAPPCLSRAARRRVRQRENKKRGKAALAQSQAVLDDGCTTDEDIYFHEVILDPALPQKATSAVKTTEIPEIRIVEVDVDHVQDVPIFPKLSMKSVPVCAYQAVQRLDEMPEIHVEDAVVIKSSGKGELPTCASTVEAPKQLKVSALPCAKVESIPVVKTFIHFEMSSVRSFGSSHRSHSSSL